MSGNYLPRNAVAEAIGHGVFRLLGWRIEGSCRLSTSSW